MNYGGQETWAQTAADAFNWYSVKPVTPLWAICGVGNLAFFLRRPSRYRDVRGEDWRFLVTLALYFTVALFAISRPVTLFWHYANFLLFPLVCLAGIAGHLATPFIRRIWFGICVIGLAVYLPIQSYNYSKYANGMHCPLIAVHYTDGNEQIAQVVADIRAVRRVASLSIWGWMPGVYVLTGIPPATRDSICHFVITPGPFQRYYRRRFLADLRQASPDVFIDAVASGAFMPGWTTDDGYGSEPELRRFIDENYLLTRELALRPVPKKIRFFSHRSAVGALISFKSPILGVLPLAIPGSNRPLSPFIYWLFIFRPIRGRHNSPQEIFFP